MKGWRTLTYQILTIVGTVVAALLTVEWAGLGLQADRVIWVIAGLKIADSLVNVALRLMTTSPVGKKL